MNNEKPVFTPSKGAGAAFKIDKMRDALFDKKNEIKRLILEDGNLKAALALAGEDVEIAIRRAIKIHDEDADDEGRSSGGGCAFSIDFGEIVTAAQKMTQEQVNMVVMIAALLKGVFDAPITTDSLDFNSM